MAQLRKKDLREDEFISTVDKAYLFLSENTERWLYPLLGVLAAALAVYLGWLYLDHRENRAAFFLHEALSAKVKNAPAEEVEAKLRFVLERHPRSDAAEMARWFLAHHHVEQWNREAAVPVVEEFARRKDGLGSLASYKLALLYAADGREAEAEAMLLEMLSDPDAAITADVIIAALARLYAATGRYEEAEQRYRQVLADFPGSALTQAVQRELETLPRGRAASPSPAAN